MKNLPPEVLFYISQQRLRVITTWDVEPYKIPMFSALDVSMCQRINEIAKAWKVDQKFHLVFIDENDFGAFAVRPARHNVIAVNAGTIPSLVDFYCRVFQCFRIDGEEWREVETTHERVPIEVRALDAWRLGNIRLPPDVFTQALVMEMVRRSLHFVVDHELGHILLGHCDFAGIGPDKKITDCETKVEREEQAATSQAIELQADHMAVIAALEGIVSRSSDELPFSREIKNAIQALYGTPQARVFSAMLAIFSIFRLFDESYGTDDSYLLASHPPSPIRIVHAFAASVDFFERRTDITWSEAHALALTRLTTLGERIFARALRRAPNGIAVSLAASEIGLAYYERLKTRMAAIQSKLPSMI